MTKDTSSPSASPNTHKRKLDKGVARICGRWSTDSKYKEFVDGSVINETHYWVK